MASDLERNAVEWVVLVDKRGGDEDFRLRRWVGSVFLDGWLRDRYELVESFGRYQIHQLRPEESR